MATNAAIYCRLSWAPDGSIEKVDRQEADCRALAERIGYRVSEDHIFKDNSASAWKRDRKRPGWDALLDAIENHEVDSIIVYHGDRLVRQPWDLEMLLRLADKREVTLASVSGMRDLASTDDRFILRVEVAQACRESDNISRRVKRGWKARANKGLPVGGGKRPFGFQSDYVTLDEQESKILAEAAERLLAGQTQGGVVAWLSGMCATSTGKSWSPRSLRNLMLAPRIAGLVQSQGEMYQAIWNPIISVEDWEEIKALYADSARRNPYQGQHRRYLLAGVAECSKCGNGMSTKPTGGKNRKSSRIYFCRHCQSMGRNVHHLDTYVEGRVLQVVNEPGFLDTLTDNTVDEGVGAQIAELERRRNQAKAQLSALADHPDLSPDLIVRSLESFERRIGELRARQADTTQYRLLARVAGIDRPGWEGLELDLRAEVVRAIFRVIVLPATWHGPGFEPESVRLERRVIS